MKETKYKFGRLEIGRNEIKIYVALFLAIIIGLWTWGYIDLLNSNEYAFVRNYLTSNRIVEETLGEIKSTRPEFSNFKRHYSAGKWASKFQIVIEGSKSSGVVYIKIKSSEASWVIEEATLAANDQKFSLLQDY